MNDEIQVWEFEHTLHGEALTEARDCLSADEIKRADRFVSAELQEKFVGARAFLRQVLADHLSVQPKQIRFSYGVQGKPEIQQNGCEKSSLHFNLAHSGNLVLCAVAWRRNIGIDLEKLRVLTDMQGIAARHFAPPEVAAFAGLPEDDKQGGFFRCWTAKEAFIKATGEGLSRPLNSFAVSFLPGEREQIQIIDKDKWMPAAWSLKHLEPGRGFAAAIVAEGDAPMLVRIMQ